MDDKAGIMRTRNLGKINFQIVAAVFAMTMAPVAQAGGNAVTISAQKIAIASVSGFNNYTDDPRGQSLAAARIESTMQILSYKSGPSFDGRSLISARYLSVKVPKVLISQSTSAQESHTFIQRSAGAQRDIFIGSTDRIRIEVCHKHIRHLT